MRIELTKDSEVEIECYSVQDGKSYRARVIADNYGRLSFQNLN